MDFKGFESVSNQILKEQDRPKMFSSPSGHSWRNMPREIFSEIFMKVGVESLEDANNCRQVCKNWNQMICDLTKNQIDTIRRNAAMRLMSTESEESDDDFAIAKSLGNLESSI